MEVTEGQWDRSRSVSKGDKQKFEPERFYHSSLTLGRFVVAKKWFRTAWSLSHVTHRCANIRSTNVSRNANCRACFWRDGRKQQNEHFSRWARARLRVLYHSTVILLCAPLSPVRPPRNRSLALMVLCTSAHAPFYSSFARSAPFMQSALHPESCSRLLSFWMKGNLLGREMENVLPGETFSTNGLSTSMLTAVFM